MGIQLYGYQIDSINKMKNGCILNGGVGSGKSRTAIAYFYLRCGGDPESLLGGEYIPMDDPPKDLYIITTAMKRDKLEWDGELSPFLMSRHTDVSLYPEQKVVVDSWNNITKYKDVKNSFFIFDEQRVVGSGVWVKSFLKIARQNEWVLLSATPGDTWQDYIPVFVANKFFKNRAEFIENHVVYSRFSKFPKIDRYINTGRLIRLRNSILIDMEFNRHTVSHHEYIDVDYSSTEYKQVDVKRWNIWKNRPVENASELCYLLRKVVNTSEARQLKLIELAEKHHRMIIFYNFDYELNILQNTYYGQDFEIAEWNGHKHQPIPNSNKWIYLVQYNAGAEGWNSIKTDTIVFYSQNYSYKVMVQASGRIDRLNTPFKDLYYYHFKSKAPIDIAIGRALKEKKQFNETKFIKW